MFGNAKGEPFRETKLLQRVLQPAAEVGLGRVTWHQFRHIHSSPLNDLRVPAKIAQEQLGHLTQDKATIVGHDWGGAVAWQFAINLPQMTERLIILNLPHPNGLLRELRYCGTFRSARCSRPGHRHDALVVDDARGR